VKARKKPSERPSFSTVASRARVSSSRLAGGTWAALLRAEKPFQLIRL